MFYFKKLEMKTQTLNGESMDLCCELGNAQELEKRQRNALLRSLTVIT